MAKLELRSVVKRFGDVTVCNGIDLDVEEGQMVCLIGASGAGKSTLLRCINRWNLSRKVRFSWMGVTLQSLDLIRKQFVRGLVWYFRTLTCFRT